MHQQAQIITEEEEEDVSSESVITRRLRINRDRQGLSLINFIILIPCFLIFIFFYFKNAREIGERLFFGCTPLQCRDIQTQVSNESPVIHTHC
ncbi:hypothetical protein Hdeb2414_s0017g00506971 [Helianthus debilis subsp. tardiflorus]